MIRDSLDWAIYSIKLLERSNHLSYNKDLRKMLSNIERKVHELSRAEVYDRRTGSNTALPILKKINEEINMVEEYLLYAILAG